MNHMEIFSIRLRNLLENRGISAADASISTGISNATMSRYLNGLRIPDSECLIKIALFFGVSMDWLMGLSENKLSTYSDDAYKLYEKYTLASPTDKGIINAVLSRYEDKNDNKANQ